MKRIFTLLFFLLGSIIFAQGELVITQYYEGAASDKWIELTNVGDAVLDFTTTPMYALLFSNAAADDPTIASPSGSYQFTGTLAVGGIIVLQNSLAANPTYATGINSSVANFNGDDLVAISASNSSTAGVAWAARTDVIGDGSSWGANTSFSRNTSDVSSSHDYAPGIWTQSAYTDVDNATAGSNLRIGEYSGYSPLPVELTSFNYSLNKNSVNLTWKTATEVDNYGFEVERHPAASNNDYAATTWQKIAFVEGAGNSNSVKEYSYIDAAVQNGKYTYRLKQVDVDGQFKYSNKIEVEVGTPAKYALEQNYPNPFNPSTVISYQIQENLMVNLTVYDVLGNEVANLVNANQEAGKHQVTFNAANLSSGIYFYKLSAGNFTAIKKLMLLK